ncbi:RraA family protein [Haloarcula nitratireducens]|uniref:RraA family protein n=1 Tax=Haloarcula nitratireducens TaxID=2487749 RepID=A0AAW4PJ14_9EURY|nr:RraA family protein [Halomicroarcula nitratireducens]MBX0297275.1 RraA family protein [Halomicroarcula nitratireducens]
MNDPSLGELCDRYEQLYPGAVVDVLDDRGLADQTLSPDIAPLRDGTTAAGIAYPVEGRPNRSVDPDENMRNILRMLGDAPEHAVLAYQTNDDRAAHLGELSVVSLKARGARGAVVDGGVRDVAYVLEEEFPVFSRYRTPADAVPRWEILDWGSEAVVGGVEVAAGDVIVGDVDGVVVVPESVRVSVLEDAEDLADTENEVREAVRDGTAPIDAYDEYGVF